MHVCVRCVNSEAMHSGKQLERLCTAVAAVTWPDAILLTQQSLLIVIFQMCQHNLYLTLTQTDVLIAEV